MEKDVMQNRYGSYAEAKAYKVDDPQFGRFYRGYIGAEVGPHNRDPIHYRAWVCTDRHDSAEEAIAHAKRQMQEPLASNA